DYLRARLEIAADGRACVETFPTQDSSMLMTLTHADVLVRRRPFAAPAQAGDLVEVIRFDRLDSML
ncbi:MAG: molybdopterin molybdenumtransferase MoeA, partial [Alphaproteobacteria bacterium]|nr:molybdopterin molybdenumtransferase MoeA [Alphaproteobacteria bacterium]